MATLYVDDGGSNTSPYDTWAKAANALKSAIEDAACVAGSTIYVASDHVETDTTALTYTSAGTIASPLKIISADQASGEPPTTYETMHSQSGKIERTGSSGTIKPPANAINVGIKYVAGDILFLNENAALMRFDDCYLAAGDGQFWGNSGQTTSLVMNNCTVDLTVVESIQVYSDFIWNGGALITPVGGVATYLFDMAGRGPCFWVQNVDLSDMVSGEALVDTSTNTGLYKFSSCKLASGVTFSSASISGDGTRIEAYSCGTADQKYAIHVEDYLGTAEDDTSIYLNATYDGTNEYSVKTTTTSASEERYRPFYFKLASRWCSANPTITVELVLDSATALDDSDVWIEVMYPNSVDEALRDVDKSSAAGPLATATTLTSSSETWTGTGGFSNEQKRKISVTISGGAAGIHAIYIYVGKPSETIYFDPSITVT